MQLTAEPYIRNLSNNRFFSHRCFFLWHEQANPQCVHYFISHYFIKTLHNCGRSIFYPIKATIGVKHRGTKDFLLNTKTQRVFLRIEVKKQRLAKPSCRHKEDVFRYFVPIDMTIRQGPCCHRKSPALFKCAFVPLCWIKNPLCSLCLCVESKHPFVPLSLCVWIKSSLCLCVSSPPLDVNQESAGILKKTAPTNDNGRRIPLHLQRQTKKQDN